MGQTLTEIAIRQLKPSETYDTHWDSLPGFGVRVGRRSKTYVVVVGRERRRITIGRFDAIKLADARKEAKRLLSAEPEEKTTARSWQTARDEFLAAHYASCAAYTKYQATRLLTKHFKSLDTRQLVGIGDADINKSLETLQATPSEQLHAYRAVRTFLRWCTKSPRRYIRHSPMEGYDPPAKDRKRARVLTDQELKATWNASTRPIDGLFRLMTLWGTRRGETCALERKWVTDEVLTIPGTRTKNGRDLAIPLTPLAKQVLAACPSGDYFFPGQREGHLVPNSIAKLHATVLETSATTGWTPHDLRRTFRTNMARLGIARDVCEALVNHAPPALDVIYDRYDKLSEKRAALETHEAFIQGVLARA